MKGESFFVTTLLPHTGAEIARSVGGAIADESYDRRRELLEDLRTGALQVNGSRVSELKMVSDETLRVVRDLHVLADAILVRSPDEYDMQVGMIAHRRRHVSYYAPAPRITSGERSSKGGSFVIWAPTLPWQNTTLFSTALEEMRVPVTVVAATLPTAKKAVRYVLPDEGFGELLRAIAVIDTDPLDPGSAIALAELGVPVAAATTAGVDLYLENVGVYAPWDWHSVQAAAYGALGARAPRKRKHGFDLAAARETLAASAPPDLQGGPLVSIIIPTYNRPRGLRRVLQAFAQQTYGHIECIVVNDAGPSVADLVAEFPNARLVELEVNSNDCGTTPVNEGAKHVRGKYVGFMADDDLCYPDHVARMVDVLERTGLSLAHGNIAIRFLDGQSGKVRTAGFAAAGAVQHLDPQRALSANTISLTTALIRRDVLEKVGYYSTEFWAIADNELLLRLSLIIDCAHVDHVTTEWRVDVGGSNDSVQRSDLKRAKMKELWRRHARPDRPSLEKFRAEILANAEKLKPGELYRTPTILFDGFEVSDF